MSSSMLFQILKTYGRRHFNLFTNCHVSQDTLYLTSLPPPPFPIKSVFLCFPCHVRTFCLLKSQTEQDRRYKHRQTELEQDRRYKHRQTETEQDRRYKHRQTETEQDRRYKHRQIETKQDRRYKHRQTETGQMQDRLNKIRTETNSGHNRNNIMPQRRKQWGSAPPPQNPELSHFSNLELKSEEH